MKNQLKFRSLVLTTILMMSVTSLFAGIIKTEKFKVSGNCGMCEARIEKAAKTVNGVNTADWNKETKIIEVSFDVAETNIQKIQEAIAKAGHDTELFKADDKTYASLPGCCKYERTAKQSAGCCSESSKGCDE